MSTITLPTSITTQTAITAGVTYVLQGDTIISGAANPPFTATANQGVGTVIDGRGYTITINGITNFAGLFSSNHSRNLSGITIQNFTISSANTTLSQFVGWVCGGDRNSGGPVGVTLCNILNTAPVTFPNCTAFLGDSPSNSKIINCGNVGQLAGGGRGLVGIFSLSCTASNCFNTSSINSIFDGGIFGCLARDSSAFNCYNTGALTNGAGPIFGLYDEGYTRANAVNCYSTYGTISSASVRATNSGESPVSGVWDDRTALRYLLGGPFPLPGLGTIWASSGQGIPFTLLTPVSTLIQSPLTLRQGTAYYMTANSTVSGTTAPFRVAGGGIVFDGRSNTIAVNNTPNFQGLFNASLSVRNLSLTATGTSTISGGAGWFIGSSGVSGAIISNCVNNGNLTTQWSAGFVGSNAVNCVIQNSVNNGALGAFYTGGFFGKNAQYCSVTNSTNNGVIYTGNEGAGGGFFGDIPQFSSATNCVNNASLGGTYAGGIFSINASNCSATNCTNNGSMNNTQEGGIMGRGASNCTITNCVNNGFINTINNGGIIGAVSISCTLVNCVNNGQITSDSNAGMVAVQSSNCTVVNSTNNGSMGNYCSGIYGISVSGCIASNCTNNGTRGGGQTGGIFGSYAINCSAINCTGRAPYGVGDGASIFGRQAQHSRAINCVSSDGGSITGYTGGIYGFNPASCTAINCINTTSIGGAQFGTAGGIIAYANNCTVTNCYNIGTCLNPELGSFAIIGDWDGDTRQETAVNCYTTNGPIGGRTPVNCSSNSDGVWNDATATASRNGGNGLTGTPFYNPDATTTVGNPAIGVSWYSTGINTPFLQSGTIPPCFVAGTRILTPTGYKCVETLKDHDEVVTSNGRTVTIKVYKTTIGKTDEDTAPYVIPKDAFGLNNPDEDLHLSGKHIIQDGRGVWQAPMYISCARQYGVGSPMTYYHIECPDYFHDDLIANGAVVESFRNKQGTSEVSYTWNEELRGYTRVMEESETGFADKHVLNCC